MVEPIMLAVSQKFSDRREIMRAALQRFPGGSGIQVFGVHDRVLITNNLRAAVLRKEGKHYEVIYGVQLLFAKDLKFALDEVQAYMEDLTWSEVDNSSGTTIHLPK